MGIWKKKEKANPLMDKNIREEVKKQVAEAERSEQQDTGFKDFVNERLGEIAAFRGIFDNINVTRGEALKSELLFLLWLETRTTNALLSELLAEARKDNPPLPPRSRVLEEEDTMI